MLEKVNKWLPLAGWTSVIGIIVTAIYFSGGFMKEVEGGLLTPVEKNTLIEHEAVAPNEVDNYIMYKNLDSILKVEKKNSDDAVRSRSERDSIIKENQRVNKLNADQIYQTRKDIDTILKYIKNK